MNQPSEYVRSCYDAVAREYADRYAGELAHKPRDRELLARFADQVRGCGEVFDLGCGPGLLPVSRSRWYESPIGR